MYLLSNFCIASCNIEVFGDVFGLVISIAVALLFVLSYWSIWVCINVIELFARVINLLLMLFYVICA